MDELTRFARQLVERLGTRPEGINRPVSIAEVRKSVLPYRAQRRALGLESVEDYETVLLRLVAEERGYVKTLPPTTAARCREVLAHSNPDLNILDDVADSTIQVTSLAAGRIVGHDGAADPAAPLPEPPVAQEPRTVPEPAQRPPASGAGRAPKVSPEQCRLCQAPVPAGRKAVFCHQCGSRLIPILCGGCGEELESGWRHCIGCGLPVPPASTS